MNQLRRVARALKFFLNPFIFAGLEPGAGNFVHLKTQQVQLLRVGFLIHDERGFFAFERGPALNQSAKRRPLLFQTAERIENGQLLRRMQKRLVVVRAVHIHEPFAYRRQDVQRGGRAVDELAVCSTGGEGAFEDKLIFLARLQAVFLQKKFQPRARIVFLGRSRGRQSALTFHRGGLRRLTSAATRNLGSGEP